MRRPNLKILDWITCSRNERGAERLSLGGVIEGVLGADSGESKSCAGQIQTFGIEVC